MHAASSGTPHGFLQRRHEDISGQFWRKGSEEGRGDGGKEGGGEDEGGGGRGLEAMTVVYNELPHAKGRLSESAKCGRLASSQ
jgi:hypothetical protein